MSSTESDIRNDLDILIKNNYLLPPKSFGKEELAVANDVVRLAYQLQQPKSQQSLIIQPLVKSIEEITKQGQLTLVAEHLDKVSQTNSGIDFLSLVEKTLQVSDVAFEYGGQQIVLPELYEQCTEELVKQKGGKPPSFGDILLRMYTKECPFYKKLNAIAGGYNDPNQTSDGEKNLALLLNIAIHKAAIEKKRNELQSDPNLLFRGQSFGLKEFENKYNLVVDWQKKGKLKNISPEELAQINIVSIVAKKTASTTDKLSVATEFVSKGSVVLHVVNPKMIADFCNVANISAVASESEFISRVPDDVAMIPVAMEEDKDGIIHIDVVCIRSQNVLFNSSNRYGELCDSLKQHIKKVIDENPGYYASYLYDALSSSQVSHLKELHSLIENIDSENPNQFIEKGIKIQSALYKDNPTPYQKNILDNISRQFEILATTAADLLVLHRRSSSSILVREQEKLAILIEGKAAWYRQQAQASMAGEISNNFTLLFKNNASYDEIRKAASNIRALIPSQNMQSGMDDIIACLDRIERYRKNLPPENDKERIIREIVEKKEIVHNLSNMLVMQVKELNEIPTIILRIPDYIEGNSEHNKNQALELVQFNCKQDDTMNKFAKFFAERHLPIFFVGKGLSNQNVVQVKPESIIQASKAIFNKKSIELLSAFGCTDGTVSFRIKDYNPTNPKHNEDQPVDFIQFEFKSIEQRNFFEKEIVDMIGSNLYMSRGEGDSKSHNPYFIRVRPDLILRKEVDAIIEYTKAHPVTSTTVINFKEMKQILLDIKKKEEDIQNLQIKGI